MNNNYLTVNQMKNLAVNISIENAKYALIELCGIEVVVPKLKLKGMNKSNYKMIWEHIYSIKELLDMIPSHIHYMYNDYKLKIEKYGLDSYSVFYQNIYNKDDKQFEFYGTEFVENLYYMYKTILINRF